MASFQRAVAEGADLIELDVRLTEDFHLVVHHDRNVRRTTNGKGEIRGLTLPQLRSLDAGSWFSPRFEHERIPTLREVMEYLLPSRVNLNIEAKTDGDPRKRIHFEECIILIIMEKRFEDRVLVSSFDHKFLKRMNALFPAIRTGALFHPVRDVRKKPSVLCSRIGATAFICSRTQVRRPMVEDAHAHKVMVAVYGVNTAQHFDKMVSLGADAIVTDWPGKMVRRRAM